MILIPVVYILLGLLYNIFENLIVIAIMITI